MTLTDPQSRALGYITIIHNKMVTDMLANDPQAKPSPWIFMIALAPFGVTTATVEALARKGYVELKSSDGSGRMVRRINGGYQ